MTLSVCYWQNQDCPGLSHNLRCELPLAQKAPLVSFWVPTTGNNDKGLLRAPGLTILSCSLPAVNLYLNSSALVLQAGTKRFIPKAEVVIRHKEGL